METIDCKHREQIRVLGHGLELGTCSICRQEVQYHMDRLKDKSTVIKLGRIDGRIVLPNPLYQLLLNPKDLADLDAARKAERERHPSPSATKVSQGDQVTQEVPPRPKKRHQLPGYYEDNKEAILHDYQSLKLREFFTKWHISTMYWGKLRERWGVQGKQAKRKTEKLTQSRHVVTVQVPWSEHLGQLPALPPWQDNWAPEVQVRWLDIYEKLLVSREGG